MQRALVVFDLDDTLYLERDFARSGYHAASLLLHTRCVPGQFAEKCLELLMAGRRSRIFDEALEQLGIEREPSLIAELVRTYRTHRPSISLAPDAQRYFASRDSGFRGALVTDGPLETQEAKIRALGLNRLLECIVCTGGLGPGFGKPHARPFEIVEAWAEPYRLPLIYVADNPLKDFVTPKARGWRTIQIERPERVHQVSAQDQRYQAHASIRTFDELDSCLEELIGQVPA